MILRNNLMKNITKGIDDLIYRLQIQDDSGTEILLSDFNDFTVSVFTADITSAIDVTEYIDSAENLLRVPSQELSELADGIIRMKVTVAMIDSEFPDSTFDQSRITDTCYFLKTYTA